MTHVVVFTHFSTVEALVRTYDSLVGSLGSGFTMMVAAPDFALAELASLTTRSCPQANVLPNASPVDLSNSLNGDHPVLLLPSGDCSVIQGVASCLILLDEMPDVLSIGGLIVDHLDRVNSFGFTPMSVSSDVPDLLVGVEETDELWTAIGRYAYLEVVGPTPFSLVRAGRVTPEMCVELSGTGHILSQVLAAEGNGSGKSIIYSGLLMRTHEDAVPCVPDDGSVEILPSNVYLAWQAQGVRQINILHTGYAVRDDRKQRVLHVTDRSVRAADGKRISGTVHPSETLLSPSFRRQLGPGFANTMAALSGKKPSKHLHEEHWGSYEHRVVALAKRVDGLLPHGLRTRARWFLERN